MPGERAIDSMDDQTKPRSDLSALPRPLSSTPEERNQALIIYPGEQISTLYLPNQEQLYPGFHHPCRGSGPQTLWTIKSNQVQTLMLYLGFII